MKLSGGPAGPTWHRATDVYLPLCHRDLPPFLAMGEFYFLVVASDTFDRARNVTTDLSTIAPTATKFSDVITAVQGRKGDHKTILLYCDCKRYQEILVIV
jgi:hypothetical protein